MSNSTSPLNIDGSHGEGGGQIVRTALALSAILRRPVDIQHIRAGRKKPGLRPQHMAAVKAVSLTTMARTEGACLGSTRLLFEPKTLQNGTFELDVGTAGATGLVLQAMMPGLFFANGPSEVVIKGGTHVPWSPCFHYLQAVFLHALKEMNGVASLEIGRWGWYPKGGGRLVAKVSSSAGFRRIKRMEPGALEALSVLSAVSNLPAGIGKRQKDQVLRRLAAKGYGPSNATVIKAPSPAKGTMVFLTARFKNGRAGFTALGARGKPAEMVGDEAASKCLDFIATGACVDCHLADQLVLYMALAKGRSMLTSQAVTRHLLTNIRVIEQFLPVTFQVDEASGTVSVDGAGIASTSPFQRS
jgi:RNA 3'-terminal phosphate cyclase (ATP)